MLQLISTQKIKSIVLCRVSHRRQKQLCLFQFGFQPQKENKQHFKLTQILGFT